MSLFEHHGFQYRETCFVLFPQENRPKLAEVLAMVEKLGERYKIGENEAADDGLMESVTIFCPHDHAALDISFVVGEEVMEHLGELADEFPTETLDEAELAKWREAQSYDARAWTFSTLKNYRRGPKMPMSSSIPVPCLSFFKHCRS